MVQAIIKPISGQIADYLATFDLKSQTIPTPGTTLTVLGFEPLRR
jgi:hypothetical protein